MDNEGQSAKTPVFQSGDIGSQATPEYFSNIKGGKKDKEKVEKKRARISRKTLLTIFGSVFAILIIILAVTLIANLTSRHRGSRTDEEMPATIQEIEKRTYSNLYHDGLADYPNALTYLTDLINDMTELNQNSEMLFCANVFRTKLIFQGGLKDRGINMALTLAKKANTDYEKYCVYNALAYMYSQENNIEKRDFYVDLREELNYNLETEGIGG